MTDNYHRLCRYFAKKYHYPHAFIISSQYLSLYIAINACVTDAKVRNNSANIFIHTTHEPSIAIRRIIAQFVGNNNQKVHYNIYSKGEIFNVSNNAYHVIIAFNSEEQIKLTHEIQMDREHKYIIRISDNFSETITNANFIVSGTEDVGCLLTDNTFANQIFQMIHTNGAIAHPVVTEMVATALL